MTSVKADTNELILAVLYMDRFINSGFCPKEHNINLAFLVGLMLARKYLVEGDFSHVIYSIVANVNPIAMNHLEAEFLMFLEYELYVDHNSFEQYKEHIVNN